MPHRWDYLILTASNDRQAAGYESQLAVRTKRGRLDDVGQSLGVADPLGKRVGSGGSTLYCLMRVLEKECLASGKSLADWDQVEEIFRQLRILILHAGGDSRRVPAYGPCGKIFSPVPGPCRGGLPSTLFDRLYPLFRSLPKSHPGDGQIVVAAGDAIMIFDAAEVLFDRPGMVALGVAASPEAAAKHGVFCVEPDGRLRMVLQKPSPAEQARLHATRSDGQSILDIGLMNFDAGAAVEMLRALGVQLDGNRAVLPAESENLILSLGLDLYREMACALGHGATQEQHRATCQASGSRWPAEQLARLFVALNRIPAYCEVVPQCSFLHFGTTKQLISSGQELLRLDRASAADGLVSVNNRVSKGVKPEGGTSWIEGCRIDAPLKLAADNVVVGVDVTTPLELPRGAVLDVIAGRDANGKPVFFVRCYSVTDTFKDTLGQGATLTGRPILEWLRCVGLPPDAVWPAAIPAESRSLWDAKVFPAVASVQGYRDWLWMFDPAQASLEQKRLYLQAERYSVAEIALLADMDAFYQRRSTTCDTL
jgi:fucokinase